jgi:hypothetical protein
MTSWSRIFQACCGAASAIKVASAHLTDQNSVRSGRHPADGANGCDASASPPISIQFWKSHRSRPLGAVWRSPREQNRACHPTPIPPQEWSGVREAFPNRALWLGRLVGSGSVNMLDNQGRQCGMALPCATIPKTGLAAGHVPSQFWHPFALALLGGGRKRRNSNSIMPSLLPIAGESQVENREINRASENPPLFRDSVCSEPGPWNPILGLKIIVFLELKTAVDLSSTRQRRGRSQSWRFRYHGASQHAKSGAEMEVMPSPMHLRRQSATPDCESAPNLISVPWLSPRDEVIGLRRAGQPGWGELGRGASFVSTSRIVVGP